jgi:hypothetical protein
MKNDHQNRPPITLRPTEYYAVNFENLIRKEEGNKLREKYTIPIPNEYKNKIELWK